MRRGIILGLVVLMSGCASVASSMSVLAHPRLSEEGRAQELKEAAVTKTPGSDSDSPVTSYGTSVDRVTGIEYAWTIYANGATILDGHDPMTHDSVKVFVPLSGDVYTVHDHLHSAYNPDTDICHVVGGETGRGLQCIHPMTRHFFLNHKFDSPHPMIARVRE